MSTHSLAKMLAEANAVIDTVAVHDAVALVNDPNVIFVDIRETAERLQAGVIPGAVHAPRGFLEFIADPAGPMHNEAFSSNKKLLPVCATGGRSTLATKTLLDMGIRDVAHIAGGFAAWREAGGPTETWSP